MRHADREKFEPLIQRIAPGFRVVAVRKLGPQASDDEESVEKAIGYGTSLLLETENADRARRKYVFRTGKCDSFGHDRRADRAGDAVLSYDTFPLVPDCVQAREIGAIDGCGGFLSLVDAGEFYLLTDFIEGAPYAEDLETIAKNRRFEPGDRDRCRALADWLVALHAEPLEDAVAYLRAIRDLIGHGEGIFGLVDNFAEDVPGAPLERVQRIEASCAAWRPRLRRKTGRLRRTHGDFHPFNILFTPQGEVAVLDASRGAKGDPADDVVCLAINYVFFALENPGLWEPAYSQLWREFWARYLERSGDAAVLEAAPPFLAWRILVLTNPKWYPGVGERERNLLLSFAERSLEQGRLEPTQADGLFR